MLQALHFETVVDYRDFLQRHSVPIWHTSRRVARVTWSKTIISTNYYDFASSCSLEHPEIMCRVWPFSPNSLWYKNNIFVRGYYLFREVNSFSGGYCIYYHSNILTQCKASLFGRSRSSCQMSMWYCWRSKILIFCWKHWVLFNLTIYLHGTKSERAI